MTLRISVILFIIVTSIFEMVMAKEPRFEKNLIEDEPIDFDNKTGEQMHRILQQQKYYRIAFLALQQGSLNFETDDEDILNREACGEAP